ncbi:MAG: Na(+)/H(+) antiporter subunit D [Gammaproteobacteria bacterium]|uniref:Na(+)/H(+) antiporter subunit D n=1 Tax=Rhodoferax sp. TaxID=50421 RepID=UPI0017E900E5|nr:Na(+)/H(+) antiporter subunit D [Rhodoferax sp.]MBU3900991.1 Na(+)/H(+) antiporter subunit D [Gammaproteobacteria bacterium]MBA3058317.1 Na(+)/H(+) antiporter subunit D [Rhodoferax sp.]MBU3996780.1 Na(+)/H(+) antiporter subunit D [Gammaproteobacteria bacterium]MBU4017665.1 Na(+)/H(+) antiporter subunit D [Gammaproteobacteria bacterium]MBU4081108.1 Na(+)/H(+) antiporter subunit D [Gammaproteobacteria bacterium]
MTELVIHPGLVLIVGALLLPLLRGTLRSIAVVALPLLVLALVWQVPDGPAWQLRFLDYTITPLQGDKLSRLFATIFSLMAAGGGLFALSQKSRIEVPAAFVYAGSAIGVALAGDLVTVFAFWELMAIGSTLVLWSQGTDESYRAAQRYLMIHLLGGVLLFAGVTGHIVQTGDVAFTRMVLDSPAHWLILMGFLVNAGAPPLSAWLPDAYPQASWSGTVFLSAFTTKTAVYVLIRGFPGTELLIWVGLFMAFYGIVYGLLENDIRRILAYTIVNQGGLMMVGVGIGTEMALNGAAAQAFAGVIYVALLLMSAGSVMLMTGRRKCSELGGLFRTMPLTATCAMVGALSISAFPLTSGFVSKSMVSQAALNGHLLPVWLLLVAASAGALLHAGIKYPWFVFFQKDSGLRPAEPPASMRWAMVAFAFLCIALGVWPEPLYALLPFAVNYVPYTGAHVLTQLQLLLFSGLAFFMLLPYLKRTLTITLDTDWIWRRLLPALQLNVGLPLVNTWHRLMRGLLDVGSEVLTVVMHQHRQDGRFARTWSTRSMALWVLVLLLGYLILYYV